MSFDSRNCSMNIQNIIGTPIPNVGNHLGVCGLIPLHSFTLLGVWMWILVTFLAYTFPCPCFGHKPKVRVVIIDIYKISHYFIYWSQSWTWNGSTQRSRKWWHASMSKELISPFQLQTIAIHLQMKPTLIYIKL
jgi:hypothetical protein